MSSNDDLLDEFMAKRLRGEDPIGSLVDDSQQQQQQSLQRSFGDDLRDVTVDEDGEFVVNVDDNAIDDNDAAADGNDANGGGSSSCCVCNGCSCSCHVRDDTFSTTTIDAERPIDSYVVYLFDYELFTVPQNYNKFEILYDYLNEERIFDRAYVVSVTSDTRRDDYALYPRNKGGTVESKLERSDVDANVLRYRPSIVESVDETRNDIRQRFRGLIVQGSRHDWFTVKSVLNYPSFIVYVRVLNSKNNLPCVDHTILVDPSHKSFISTPGTQGLKIARILAHTRSKYFGIDHFNFARLLEQSNLRIIQRSAAVVNRTDGNR